MTSFNNWSGRRVQWFIQRPSGYMSVYSRRGLRHDIRNRMKHQGERDPVYVLIRLPAFRRPVAPRKFEAMR